MTQSPIEPPNNSNPRSDDVSGRGPSRPLKFDEMIAVAVAFLTLGSVLFFGLSRSGSESIFGDAAAPLGRAEGDRAGLLFGDDDDTEDAVVGAVPFAERELAEAEEIRPSAQAELARRAAARRERAGIESSGNVWDDFRTGAAGTAAGVAGVAATAGGAEALPEEEVDAGTAEPAEAEVAQPTEEAQPAAGAVTASEAASAEPNDPIGFSDVPDGYWAKPYIDGLSSRGLISGFDSGEFQPDAPVTRAQLANIVSRTFNLTANQENLEFSDVASDFWARESIGEVVRGGFMTGFPDDTFKPSEPVTRAQAFTTLVTGLGIMPPNNVQPTIDRYSDVSSIPNWANEKIAAATVGDLVVNYPEVNEINASQPTTRAELATMIYQALARAQEGEASVVDPIDSEYLVKP